MKNFKAYLGIIFLCMSGMQNLYAQKPRQAIAAYSNKVESADFSDQHDGSYWITLYSQKEPICFYMPQTLEESLDSHVKRYILPRTEWSDSAMGDFMSEHEQELISLGIACRLYKIPGVHFKLGIIFEIDSSHCDIEKVVDHNEKFIRFIIRIKK